MFCLDTNVIIGVMSASSTRTTTQLQDEVGRGTRVLVPAIVIYELRFAIAKSARRTANESALDLFLASLETPSFDTADAAEAADIRAGLHRRGTPIGPYDILMPPRPAAAAPRWSPNTENSGAFPPAVGTARPLPDKGLTPPAAAITGRSNEPMGAQAVKITRVVKKILDNYESDCPGTKTNLARILMHGRLGGSGKMVILPVDQGFEHGPARSFAPNPDAYDPHYHYQLAVDAGLNAYAAPLGPARGRRRHLRRRNPDHPEAQLGQQPVDQQGPGGHRLGRRTRCGSAARRSASRSIPARKTSTR